MEAKQYVKEVRQLVRIANHIGSQDVRDAMETAIRGFVHANLPAAFEQAQANLALTDVRHKAASVHMLRAEQALDRAAVMGSGMDAINAILDYRAAQDEYRAAKGELQSAMYWYHVVPNVQYEMTPEQAAMMPKRIRK